MEANTTILDRVRAVPAQRRVFLPLGFSRDEAGRCTAEILRLSAENHNDMLLWLPPYGSLHGSLALGDLLATGGTAPVIGLLWGEARTATPALLQTCAPRLITPHATLAPRRIDSVFQTSASRMNGPPGGAETVLGELRNALTSLKQDAAHRVWQRISTRIGVTISDLMTDVADRPAWNAGESVRLGWADAVLQGRHADLDHEPTPPTVRRLAMDAVQSERVVRIQAELIADMVAASIALLFRLSQEGAQPLLVLFEGDTADFPATTALLDHLAMVPCTVVGLASGTLGLLDTAALQGCTIRAARATASFHLAVRTDWTQAEITITEEMPPEEAERMFLLEAGRIGTRAVAVAEVLASRSRVAAEEWSRRMKGAVMMSAEEAVSDGVLDVLLD